jgi:hypothetical protein
MSPHYFFETSFQGSHVQQSAQVRNSSDVIRRGFLYQLVDYPQPLLINGQREHEDLFRHGLVF